MKKLQDINPNTRWYWNNVYGGQENRDKYERETWGMAGASKRLPTALEQVKSGEKVLDIGCGIGMFTEMVKDKYPECEVWGTDIADKTIQTNSEKRPDINYRSNVIGDTQKLPTDFDFIFSGEVLEHLDEPIQLFKDAHSLLKEGGRFLISTPLENRIGSTEHVWSYTHEDIEKLFTESGFKKIRFIYLPDMEHMYLIMCEGVK